VSLALLEVLSVIVGALFGLRAALCFALFMVLQTLFTTFHARRLWRLLDAALSQQEILQSVSYDMEGKAARGHKVLWSSHSGNP